MKIGVLSDIHVDINTDEKGDDRITPLLVEEIQRQKVDCFICAGDIASDHTRTLEVVDTIENETGKACYFVSGNHDLWNDNHPGKSTREIYDALKMHPGNIANGPLMLGANICLVGDAGWYDYSFGSNGFSFEDFEKMTYGERVWQDSIKAPWQDQTTHQVHSFFLSNIRRQIKKAGNKKIIAVTHVLPIDAFCVPTPDPEWEYFNAFLGSRAYGDLLLDTPGVCYSISGHVHYRKTKKMGGINFICNCLGYHNEWYNKDPKKEIASAFTVVEIN